MPIAEKGPLQIHYEWTGAEDAPVLMLANGLGLNLHMWDKVIPFFQNSYHVLRYDMRGHGRSSASPPANSMEHLGEDALFLLDTLGIGRMNLCGLSLGGQVTMWVAMHAPERLNRIVLANTAPCIGTREGWNERIGTVQVSGMEPVALAQPPRWFTQAYREQHPEEMKWFQTMVTGTDPAGYAGCCAALRDTDYRGEIHAIQTPSLVIAGAHDSTTPPSEGGAMQAALPEARYIEFDASHLSAWEKAEEFAGAVLTFLAHSRLPEEEPRYG